jgi:FkbM family methyltransferase
MVVPAACSDTVGLAMFHEGENNAAGSLGEAVDGSGNEGATIVPTITVDALVVRLGLSPHAMNIDVEGAEFLVLKGARATIADARPRNFLSVHSEHLRDECLGFLAPFGSRFVPLSDPTLESASEILAIAE